MSKKELQSSGEHRRCGFANGAGNCANDAGNWLLMREKHSIHL